MGRLENSALLGILKEQFPDDVLEISVTKGEAAAVLRTDALVPAIRFLREDERLQLAFLADITAVDYLTRRPRFDVVYQLLSLSLLHRLRLKLRVDPDETVESLSAIWGCANWLEREVWDMFGIRFAGHPNLKRLLMYEEFQGHPLRKDYPVTKRQPLVGPKN